MSTDITTATTTTNTTTTTTNDTTPVATLADHDLSPDDGHTSPDRRDIWETYALSWKADTAEAKRELFRSSLSEDCVYTDPLTRTRGWDDLTEYMLDFHRQIPGGHFVTTEFRTHHDHSLARWNMVAGNGTVVGDGASHARYGADGKLVAMTGFFDAPAGS